MGAVGHVFAGIAAGGAAVGVAAALAGRWQAVTMGSSDPMSAFFYLLGAGLMVAIGGMLFCLLLWPLTRAPFVERWWFGMVISGLIFIPAYHSTI